MPLYVYLKEDNSPKKKVINYFSYVSLLIGALLLFWAFYPIFSFEIYSRLFIQQPIISPLPSTALVSSIKEASSVLGGYNLFSANLRDFTNASLWFPTKKQTKHILSTQEYSISIPKLNINNAKVIVGEEDLSKGLIHYLPSSLPGEFGNVVLFGHSTLPQLYNPNDYKTIFTYLPSLEKGDKIIVHINSLDYEYEVYDMFVIKPEEISILEQNYNESYLTLVTCVPPGTYWMRLVVKAKLTKLPR